MNQGKDRRDHRSSESGKKVDKMSCDWLRPIKPNSRHENDEGKLSAGVADDDRWREDEVEGRCDDSNVCPRSNNRVGPPHDDDDEEEEEEADAESEESESSDEEEGRQVWLGAKGEADEAGIDMEVGGNMMPSSKVAADDNDDEDDDEDDDDDVG